MKKIVIGLISAAVLVGLYFAFRSPHDDMDHMMMGDHEMMGDMEGMDHSMPEGKKMAFSSFIKHGGDYECSVHQYIGGADTVGHVFVSDQKVRGEFGTKVQGMDVDTTFVVKDGYSYTWSSMMPSMGYKSKVEMSTENATAPSASQYSFNAEQIGDYDCKSWTADESKFTLPSGVTFTDVSAQAR